MKLTQKIVFVLILTIGLMLAWTANPGTVFAGQIPLEAALTATPLPTLLQTTSAATPTIDPASIGDTTGVISIGIIVVAVILVGVVWGYHEFRMGVQKARTPQE